MKPAELEDWKRSARPKAIEKRSKVIVRMDKVIVESETDKPHDLTNNEIPSSQISLKNPLSKESADKIRDLEEAIQSSEVGDQVIDGDFGKLELTPDIETATNPSMIKVSSELESERMKANISGPHPLHLHR